jgi:hypothetical protein
MRGNMIIWSEAEAGCLAIAKLLIGDAAEPLGLRE